MSFSAWKLFARGLAASAVAAAVVAAALLAVVRHRLNDGGVPVSTALIPPGAPRRVMAVWAHPDDEVTSAGALAALARSGARVSLVYFTHGEAAHHTGYSAGQLWHLRPQEAAAAARAIGAQSVTVLDYGDGRLSGASGERARADLRRLIATERPSVLVGFDERVGYYGHPDHVQAGRWTAQVFRAGRADPAFPVRRLYQATLPQPVIALARRYIRAFRDHYPAPPAPGLPAPTVAVPIAAEAAVKRAVLDAHLTQRKVIDDVQPFGRKLPPWLYYRLLDREYFAQAPP